MRYAQSVADLVGDTPLVRLSRVTDGVAATVLAKIEYFNPGGSAKDRIAANIVDAAERVLLSLFGKTYKMTRGRTRKPHEIFFWANKSNVVESRKCCQLATRLLDETQHRRLSDLELRMLVSSLAIVLPPSHNFWIQLDELLSQHILRHGLSSMQLQTGLLCSHSRVVRQAGRGCWAGRLLAPRTDALRILLGRGWAAQHVTAGALMSECRHS